MILSLILVMFLFPFTPWFIMCHKLRIGSCLACVYRVMDACGKFGEHERSIRVAQLELFFVLILHVK